MTLSNDLATSSDHVGQVYFSRYAASNESKFDDLLLEQEKLLEHTHIQCDQMWRNSTTLAKI